MHVEAITDLSTAAFIATLKKFIARCPIKNFLDEKIKLIRFLKSLK